MDRTEREFLELDNDDDAHDGGGSCLDDNRRRGDEGS